MPSCVANNNNNNMLYFISSLVLTILLTYPCSVYAKTELKIDGPVCQDIPFVVSWKVEGSPRGATGWYMFDKPWKGIYL